MKYRQVKCLEALSVPELEILLNEFLKAHPNGEVSAVTAHPTQGLFAVVSLSSE